MSIAQTQSPVNPSVGARRGNSLGCGVSGVGEQGSRGAETRFEPNLKHSLEDCSTHSMFDTKFLVELSFSEQSRDELLGLVGAIAHRLTEVAQ